MSTPLSALSNLISSGIATIESTYAKHGAAFPSMDEPFQPGPLDDDEALCTTIDHVISAATQLIALVKPPPRTVVECGFSVIIQFQTRDFIFPSTKVQRTSFISRQAFRSLWRPIYLRSCARQVRRCVRHTSRGLSIIS